MFGGERKIMDKRTKYVFLLCGWIFIFGACIISCISGKEATWPMVLMPVFLIIVLYIDKINKWR
jgi:hypothetical protein